MTAEKIIDALDKYRSAVERHVRRSVDAVSCGTPADWRAMHKAEDEENEIRKELEQMIEEK